MDDRFVGFNLVMPEDAPVPMRDFSLHMRMIDFLHSLYPSVKITLHAGELAEGLVPPEGMTFHIRESIGRGHASRIGHGTAILHETNADSVMREMAQGKILVEVSLFQRWDTRCPWQTPSPPDLPAIRCPNSSCDG